MKPNNIRIAFAIGLIIGPLINPARAQLQTAPPVFVDIDATGLPPGQLTSIPNSGTLSGFFEARGGGATVPLAAPVDGGGTMGIRFDGGDYMQHVATVGGALVPAPAGLVGLNPTCTIEVWVLNGAIDRDEGILAWGKRGGPAGTSQGFNYGWDAAWGAVGHWGAQDIGWTSGVDGGGVYGANVPSAGVWHHLAYTFDGTTQRVYADGVLKNSEVVSLNTASGPPIILAAQTEANGTTVTPTLRGSLTIGKVRIHDGVLTADQISTNYLLEVSAFTNGPGTQLIAGPTHRYQFDNAAGAATAGSTILDSAGTSNGTVLGSGGTFTGSRLTLPGGASGTAAYVDLPDGLLSVNSTNKGGSGEVTIEGWAKQTASRTWARLFDFGSSSGGSGLDYVTYIAQVNAEVHAHRLTVQNTDAVGGTGGGGTLEHGSTTYGQDFHFAVTWNDATGEMRVFENGAFVGRRTEVARMTQFNDVNNWLGRSQWSGDLSLQGELDEFRTYNRVLTDAELRGNFLRGPDTVSAQLTMFTVTGGGTGCGSVPVGLSGSEVGVTYLLRTNLLHSGVSVEGTGSPISFGSQTSNGVYSVLASNTTSAATALMNGGVSVTITIPPAITSGPNPANFTNYQGGYLAFAVAASGSSLNYQWKRDGANLINGGNISGATSNRLTIYPANPSDSAGPGHGYTCLVSNSCGAQLSSEATATIIPFVAVPETVVGVWTNRLTTTNSSDARWGLPDNEGNVIVTGYTDGGLRVTAIKYSSTGIPLWTNDNNGALEDQDYEPQAALDGDGNLIVAKGFSQIVVDKYSGTNGLLLWEKRISSGGSVTIGLAVDSNGDVVVVGKTYNTNYIAKYSAADGTVLWQTNRQAHLGNDNYWLALDSHGNAVVAGWGGNTGSTTNNVFVTKHAAADGSIIWEKKYANGITTSAVIGASGDVYVSGHRFANNQYDIFVLKIASTDGALLWDKLHNAGPGAANDQSFASALDGDENVIVTGLHAATDYDFYTAKFSTTDGSLLWDRRYNGPNNRLDNAMAVAVDTSGDVFVTGYSGLGMDPNTGDSTLTSDIYTAKYAGENGALLWSARFNGTANRDDTTALYCRSLATGSDGEIVVVGSTDGGFVTPEPYPSHWVAIKYSTVVPNFHPLVANPIPDTGGVYGTPFTNTFAANTFSDPDAGQTLSYAAAGMPAGITFTPATRTFSGTPTTIGTNSVTVTALDNGSPALSTNDVFDIIIAKAPLTATADNLSRTYAETNPPLTFSYASFVLGETAAVLDTPPAIDTAATNGSAVGLYPITFSGGADGHYEFSYVHGTLTIAPAPLSVTADNTNRVYGELNPAFTGIIVGVANGDIITATFSATAETNSSPGNYPISPALVDPDSKLGNYAVTTNSGVLTVTAAPLTVTATDTNRVYGVPNPAFTGSLLGVVNGDNVTAVFTTTATTSSPPGTYPITPELNDPDARLLNYLITTNTGTLTIISPPMLSVEGGGNGLVTFSWPISPAGFVLESTASLSPPLSWLEITSGITEIGGVKTYTATNDIGAPGRLYRLRLN